MKQIYLNLLSQVRKATGSSSPSQINSILRKIVTRYSGAGAAYHNKSLELDPDDKQKEVERGRSEFSHLNTQDYAEDHDLEGRSTNDTTEQSYPTYNYINNSIFRQKKISETAGSRLSKPEWKNIHLQTIKKNCYTPSKKVLNRSAKEIEEYRCGHQLSLMGENIPNPIVQFEEHEFPLEVRRLLEEEGFETPTPIQAQGWPIALSGKDFIGIGQTGSGKTLGYIIPALVHIKHQPPVAEGEGPICLILAPTTELAEQIYQVSYAMFAASGLNIACLHKGANKKVQAGYLNQKPYMCIATPGRLLDFLQKGVTNLRRCTYLVLDEADRMLNMGFEPQIRRIIDQIRPDRQTLMWSATWPKEVQEIASDFLKDDFIRVNIGSFDLHVNPDIEQKVEVCDVCDKTNRFMTKMQEMSKVHKKILVFTHKKFEVKSLARSLHKAGIRARGVHGEASPAARHNALAGFRSGRYSVLVATNVISRGLDFSDLSLVVNFDFPFFIEDYVHRIGRTGRAGNAGSAYSFLTHRDSVQVVKKLIKLWTKSNTEIPNELLEFLKRNSKSNRQKRAIEEREEEVSIEIGKISDVCYN